MKQAIVGGRVIDPGSGFDALADVFIDQGRIVAIGQAPEGFVAQSRFDASGLVVAPGLVDLCARMREPGSEGGLRGEMRAAMAGGVTAVVCPPDTDPPLDEPGLVRMLRQSSRQSQAARLYPLGALTAGLGGEKLAEMKTLHETGCVAFMQTLALPRDNSTLLEAMRYAKTFDLPLWLRPVEASLAGNGVAASGAVAVRLGLPAVSVAAETVALHTIFELQRLCPARVHLCRLSTAAGLALVAQAKREGLPVSADVGIHHVHLTDADIGYFDAHFRLDPPLRSQRDRDAIRAALIDGTLDAICSDHAPVNEDDKMLPFDEATPGASGLQTLLPLALKWAKESRLPLPRALALLTSGPARVLAEDIGSLAVGAKADMVVFDPEAPWVVDARSLLGRGTGSPYRGLELEGRVLATFVGGEQRFGLGPVA